MFQASRTKFRAVGGQLFVIDELYAAFAARHFDATLRHLKATYSTVIAHTRS